MWLSVVERGSFVSVLFRYGGDGGGEVSSFALGTLHCRTHLT